jgi:rod shape-determining protein MreC
VYSSRVEVRNRRVIPSLIAISVLLMTIDSGHSGFVNFFRSTAHSVLAPVQSLVDDAFQPLRDVAGGITSTGSLRDQNAELRREVTRLRRQLGRQKGAGSEIGRLEQLLNLPSALDVPSVTARATSGPLLNFERTVQLNRGSSSGIAVDNPVVTGDGLVGRVTAVTGHDAIVTLLDNPALSVGVRLETSRVFGVTSPTAGSTDVELTSLSDPSVSVRKGELVFTSAAANSAFPPDEPVGIVTGYVKGRPGVAPTITVTPFANLDNLDFVRVLRWPPPSSGR